MRLPFVPLKTAKVVDITSVRFYFMEVQIVSAKVIITTYTILHYDRSSRTCYWLGILTHRMSLGETLVPPRVSLS